MTESLRPTPSEIRAYRAENPKMRERDIAAQLGVSEAALVAAECGLTAVRIDADANRFLSRVEELGEVMALTRNESAVHEKIGVYEKITTGEMASIVLGEQIDLRVFPGAWAHAFAVTKTDDQGEFAVTWPAPGMYWLETGLEDDKTSIKQASTRRLSYVATFEVLQQ